MNVNKYHKWYDQLIDRARTRTLTGYVERHHIVPKSLGGTNEKSNLVRLTAREHLVAHMLLVKFVENPDPMWRALWCMANMGETKLTGKLYEQARIKLSAIQKGRPSPLKGKTMSEETKKRMSASRKLRAPHSEETKKRMSAAQKGRPSLFKGRPSPLKGKPRTEETKKRMSAAQKGRLPPTEETREKMRQAHTGKMHSNETRQRMSASRGAILSKSRTLLQ